MEVPDRFTEQTMGLDARGFFTVGTWRWEGEATVERYRFHRLITDWANPFPGPDLREPAYFWGTQALLKVSGRSANANLSVERTEQWGHGEAGERKTGVTRVKADYHAALGKDTWFVRGFAAHRDDAVSLEPAGPHPVFQGPYYDLLGPRTAPMILRIYPYTDVWVEGGVRSALWEVSGRVRHFQSPKSYAQDQDSLQIFLAWTPVRGLRLELKPTLTRASNLNPAADKFGGLGGGWQQATDFRPVNARDWKGVDATLRYQGGPFMVRALYSICDSGDAPGLQRRENGELFAGYTATLGVWTLRASGRASASDLSGAFTNYAAPGDPVDPEDPTHRLPMGEDWRRRGQSAQVDVEREFADVGTFGLLGLWDHQALTTQMVIDQPRHYQYGQAGLFWSRGWTSLRLRGGGGAPVPEAAGPRLRAPPGAMAPFPRGRGCARVSPGDLAAQVGGASHDAPQERPGPGAPWPATRCPRRGEPRGRTRNPLPPEIWCSERVPERFRIRPGAGPTSRSPATPNRDERHEHPEGEDRPYPRLQEENDGRQVGFKPRGRSGRRLEPEEGLEARRVQGRGEEVALSILAL